MPIRSLPKVHYLLLRTHKLALLLTLLPNATIAKVKEEALSALASDVNQAHAELDGTPSVSSVDDFELCRVARDGGRRGMLPTYEILDARRSLRDYGFTSWETLFFQFKSEEGELFPVTAILPTIDDEEVEVQQPSGDMMSDDASPIHTTSKGKRKAPPDESD